MLPVAREVVGFLQSEAWAPAAERLHDPDVSFFEVKVTTSIHPLSLEYLFVEYLNRIGRRVRNVGHAFVGDWAWIKIYPEVRPIVNVVWRYGDGDVIAAADEGELDTWTDQGERSYLSDVTPRRMSAADAAEVDAYLESDHWKQVLSWFNDDQIEHFHVYLQTELHPHDLEPKFTKSIAANGFELNVPPFFLARPDLGLMWIGLAPDGMTSLEIGCIHTPGIVLQPKVLTAEDRTYGGDPWTVSDLREFTTRDPYQVLLLSEVRSIVDELV